MSFQVRHWNRLKLPKKHVLVCEDFLNCQAVIAQHFSEVFEHQGEVVFSYVSGGLAAAGLIRFSSIHLILLDFDMPEGNGEDLMNWLREWKYLPDLPVITFSGLPQNNDKLMTLGAKHNFRKDEVIAGKADELIKEILK